MDEWDKMVSRDFGFDILLDSDPINDEGFIAPGTGFRRRIAGLTVPAPDGQGFPTRSSPDP